MSGCERRHCADDATFEVWFGTPQQVRLLCDRHTDLYWRDAAPPVQIGPILAEVIVHDTDEANRLVDGSDRCDRCGARAYVVCMTRTGQDLQFCGHCYRIHEPGLVKVAHIIHDCRSLLVLA